MSDKRRLVYSLQRENRGGRIYLKAQPSEWACEITCDIQPPSASWKQDSTVTEYRISWETGARNWTFEDARKFFTAGLDLILEAERLCQSIGYPTEAQ